jgi:putative DNA primase/helicase
VRAAELHARIGGTWAQVLAQLGIADEYLRLKKAGPCPACGGTDRYTFDNRKGRGDFICRGCGAGDGFALLSRVHGIEFREALRRVSMTLGGETQAWTAIAAPTAARASPGPRVHRLLRTSCYVADCEETSSYLTSRGIWPTVAPGLRAHANAPYYNGADMLGRFAALIAPVRDVTDDLVTLHLTYLHDGRKLEGQEPRKIISPMTGRVGCAARLMALEGRTLGIAEGIETALSASRLHDLPVWAALNSTLLAKFEPPPGVERLVIFADRDVAGLDAAARLMERLQGKVALELRPPRAPSVDWNDVLVTGRS